MARFLHPSQRKLVEHRWKGPARVLGGAGTGKTVVAMHRAKFLAETRYTGPDDRILVTTFTRNLAADICAITVGKFCFAVADIFEDYPPFTFAETKRAGRLADKTNAPGFDFVFQVDCSAIGAFYTGNADHHLGGKAIFAILVLSD